MDNVQENCHTDNTLSSQTFRFMIRTNNVAGCVVDKRVPIFRSSADFFVSAMCRFFPGRTQPSVQLVPRLFHGQGRLVCGVYLAQGPSYYCLGCRGFPQILQTNSDSLKWDTASCHFPHLIFTVISIFSTIINSCLTLNNP
jgi:hypothetical protein